MNTLACNHVGDKAITAQLKKPSSLIFFPFKRKTNQVQQQSKQK